MVAPSPKVLVATHGHCFDGLVSAALFTHMLTKLEGGPLRFNYLACGYGHAQRRPDSALSGADITAILDYRYSASRHLTWFFDHHPTAFESAAARQDYEDRLDASTERRMFYDPSVGSCSRLIAETATARFGLDLDDLKPVIEWADRVDTASFESAEQAVDRTSPVMQLVSVVEHYGDDRLIKRLVPRLLGEPLVEVALSPDIQRLYTPIASRHRDFQARVKQRAERRGRVVLVDLTDKPLEVIGKFVTYALYPDSTYSVVVGLLKTGVKISVGYNPWSGRRLDTDISKICARFGGGGHPVVGGIAFASKDIERARAVAREIAEELEE